MPIWRIGATSGWDPDYRPVADSLEADWDAKLRALNAVQED
jgi:hypothetical protein